MDFGCSWCTFNPLVEKIGLTRKSDGMTTQYGGGISAKTKNNVNKGAKAIKTKATTRQLKTEESVEQSVRILCTLSCV